MLEIGITESCVVKIFALYSANGIQSITKYFYDKRAKINDNVFVATLKKYESRIFNEGLRQDFLKENKMGAFKKMFTEKDPFI